MKIPACCLSALAFAFGACHAYETETHALMTDQAFSRSVLAATGPTSVAHNLGLDRLDATTPFNIYWPYSDGPLDGYLDNLIDRVYLPDEFERCNMQEFLTAGLPQTDLRVQLFSATVENPGESSVKLPIQNWLVRGAVREDDLGVAVIPTYAGARCGLFTFQQITGDTVRVLNHFYDPINNLGLNGGVTACPPGLGPCQKSVDWAQGVVDSFPAPPALPQIDTSRRNHFSYEDARVAMWNALTLAVSSGSSSPPSATDREIAAVERQYQWATVFRDLGDVVHLLQDTAQPQHTRNDPHSFFRIPNSKPSKASPMRESLAERLAALAAQAAPTCAVSLARI